MTLRNFLDKIRNRIDSVKEEIGSHYYYYGKDCIDFDDSGNFVLKISHNDFFIYDLDQEINIDSQNNRIEVCESKTGAKSHLTFYSMSVIPVNQ